jgi:glutamate racemase
MMDQPGPIGVFDSGYGGLTVFREIVSALPGYDYVYFGDNARAPYGIRSFDTIHKYTLECVEHLFDLGCRLVILACNTASAKALRTIQQQDLPRHGPLHRVLGVIRPTAEVVGSLTRTGDVGVLATPGTVKSQSYPLEIHKQSPEVRVFQQACPMWVPLVENGEHAGPGAGYFVENCLQRLLAQSDRIDTILLGCTHYPLLLPVIERYLPPGIRVLSQGQIVAESLADYLRRHPEIESLSRKGGRIEFFTTDQPEDFDRCSRLFFGTEVRSRHFELRD